MAPTNADPCFTAGHICPIQHVVDLLDNKWSILVLRELFQGQRRTGQLLDALPGCSTKTLTLRLRQLEAHGIINRDVYPEIPPRVEYSLTDKGREIQPVLAAMHQLGSQWLEQEVCNCSIVTVSRESP
ncbi:MULTISPECIES: winged helix-turn-helix transcriptional regulator [unclassified Synechocystis]|uniref:winged helix-turn-helix transcriptional regulator n=1 Tax=unclassified Synechocystis TaxID=2640012 RepID=UPI00048C1F79|nr:MULTISPECIES: winged helix-turn-helix transcriptional regulator [unclassified Synechocystis]MCT0254852.1 winged helix-turn-helix transcriptional regulator [Synechocystis sp. CS-94]